MNANEPAYPAGGSTFYGLTKRELIAAMCLQGLLSNPETLNDKDTVLQRGRGLNPHTLAADASTLYADALILELSKDQPK